MIYYCLSPNKHFKVNSFHPEEYANIFPDVFSLWGSVGVFHDTLRVLMCY
jgi:hypothetical protein